MALWKNCILFVVQETISRYYSNILREIRAEPEYFRVGFYGGFPPFLKNKVFIFKGYEYEKLSDFNARMSSQFPNAKVSTESLYLASPSVSFNYEILWFSQLIL